MKLRQETFRPLIEESLRLIKSGFTNTLSLDLVFPFLPRKLVDQSMESLRLDLEDHITGCQVYYFDLSDPKDIVRELNIIITVDLRLMEEIQEKGIHYNKDIFLKSWNFNKLIEDFYLYEYQLELKDISKKEELEAYYLEKEIVSVGLGSSYEFKIDLDRLPMAATMVYAKLLDHNLSDQALIVKMASYQEPLKGKFTRKILELPEKVQESILMNLPFDMGEYSFIVGKTENLN